MVTIPVARMRQIEAKKKISSSFERKMRRFHCWKGRNVRKMWKEDCKRG